MVLVSTNKTIIDHDHVMNYRFVRQFVKRLPISFYRVLFPLYFSSLCSIPWNKIFTANVDFRIVAQKILKTETKNALKKDICYRVKEPNDADACWYEMSILGKQHDVNQPQYVSQPDGQQEQCGFSFLAPKI